MLPGFLYTRTHRPAITWVLTVIQDSLWSRATHFIFFFIPFIILALLSRSLPVVAPIRGHIVGPPLPSPPRYNNAFIFIARRIQYFLPSSTRVDSRRLASNCAYPRCETPSAVDPFFYFFWHFCKYNQNLTTVGIEVRDQRYLVVFEGNHYQVDHRGDRLPLYNNNERGRRKEIRRPRST